MIGKGGHLQISSYQSIWTEIMCFILVRSGESYMKGVWMNVTHVMCDSIVLHIAFVWHLSNLLIFTERKYFPNPLELRTIFKVGSEVATSKSC